MKIRFLSVIVALSVVLFCVGCSSADYKKANELYDSGDYEGALELYTALGDYEDSELLKDACQKKIDYALACEKMDAGDYAEAVQLFVDLGNYEDSVSKLHTLMYFVVQNGSLESTVSKGVEAYSAFVDEQTAKILRLMLSGGELTLDPNKIAINDKNAKIMSSCATTLMNDYSAYRAIFPEDIITLCDHDIQTLDAAYTKMVTDLNAFFSEQYYYNFVAIFNSTVPPTVTATAVTTDTEEFSDLINSFKLN